MVDSILILGAGELGLSILEALSKHPKRADTKLAVLLRASSLESTAPEKVKQREHLTSLGVAFEAGDVVESSVSELAATFKKYDTVASCNGMTQPSGTQAKLVDAALEAGVPRFFPWQFGMDYDIIGVGSSQSLFDEQLAVRTKLRAQSGTKWTIVSTGLFMSFLFQPDFCVDVEKKIVRGLGSWDTRITMTTAEDIGRITADIMLSPEGTLDKVVFTSGDTVSYGEAADLIEERFGTKFERVLLDLDTLKKKMEEKPDPILMYQDTFAQGRGVAWDHDKTINVERQIPVTDLKAYLRKMKS